MTISSRKVRGTDEQRNDTQSSCLSYSQTAQVSATGLSRWRNITLVRGEPNTLSVISIKGKITSIFYKHELIRTIYI